MTFFKGILYFLGLIVAICVAFILGLFTRQTFGQPENLLFISVVHIGCSVFFALLYLKQSKKFIPIENVRRLMKVQLFSFGGLITLLASLSGLMWMLMARAGEYGVEDQLSHLKPYVTVIAFLIGPVIISWLELKKFKSEEGHAEEVATVSRSASREVKQNSEQKANSFTRFTNLEHSFWVDQKRQNIIKWQIPVPLYALILLKLVEPDFNLASIINHPEIILLMALTSGFIFYLYQQASSYPIIKFSEGKLITRTLTGTRETPYNLIESFSSNRFGSLNIIVTGRGLTKLELNKEALSKQDQNKLEQLLSDITA